jgi:hypothetical protein
MAEVVTIRLWEAPVPRRSNGFMKQFIDQLAATVAAKLNGARSAGASGNGRRDARGPSPLAGRGSQERRKPGALEPVIEEQSEEHNGYDEEAAGYRGVARRPW